MFDRHAPEKDLELTTSVGGAAPSRETLRLAGEAKIPLCGPTITQAQPQVALRGKPHQGGWPDRLLTRM